MGLKIFLGTIAPLIFCCLSAWSQKAPRFHVITLYENGGHHIEYSKRAKVWLDKLAADSNFSIDYIKYGLCRFGVFK
jgi:uncharacterized protein